MTIPLAFRDNFSIVYLEIRNDPLSLKNGRVLGRVEKQEMCARREDEKCAATLIGRDFERRLKDPSPQD